MSQSATTGDLLEVEQKFRVEDFDEIKARLRELGAQKTSQRVEHDTYLAHPVRSFADTDEAFRIRSVDDNHVLTYKGPRSGGPVKTRREIEMSVGDCGASRETIVAMFRALSFEPVADVHKTRETYKLTVDGDEITVTMDDVSGIDPHVEVEVVSTNRAHAEDLVKRAATSLNLSAEMLENRSYLELWLERAPKFN